MLIGAASLRLKLKNRAGMAVRTGTAEVIRAGVFGVKDGGSKRNLFSIVAIDLSKSGSGTLFHRRDPV